MPVASRRPGMPSTAACFLRECIRLPRRRASPLAGWLTGRPAGRRAAEKGGARTAAPDASVSIPRGHGARVATIALQEAPDGAEDHCQLRLIAAAGRLMECTQAPGRAVCAESSASRRARLALCCSLPACSPLPLPAVCLHPLRVQSLPLCRRLRRLRRLRRRSTCCASAPPHPIPRPHQPRPLPTLRPPEPLPP